MTLDDAQIRYLTSHHLGRLATVAPDGTPQNKPVGYRYNAGAGTIDIAGFNLEHSAKYRNIAAHPDVAFVIDDAVGKGAAGMRFLEIRGRADRIVAREPGSEEGLSAHIIRIHPRRIISWNVDPQSPGLQARTLLRDTPSAGIAGPIRRPTSAR